MIAPSKGRHPSLPEAPTRLLSLTYGRETAGPRGLPRPCQTHSSNHNVRIWSPLAFIH